MERFWIKRFYYQFWIMYQQLQQCTGPTGSECQMYSKGCYIT
ncbi:unnamed protein product [Paramecium sonneborni]|uniref:Uncharacterized protein n=1 Tax=Paramecium sonneborni TaxID=65129 RepID=A0A8S1RKV3_9CILI|nr:unnamed protein product [Paramecium sonneborni]